LEPITRLGEAGDREQVKKC
jgi:hypothetical protein